MLRPLLEQPDGLYFRINGQPVTFAPRISVFLVDMLEANEITATYKAARCKMPCHTCMVLRSDLNNMNLRPEDMPSRTPENMLRMISEGRNKDFSVYNIENAFWKFP